VALSEGSKGRILLKRMVVFGMDNFYSLTGSQWFSLCAIVGLIVVSLYWAWNKISGLERKVNWLEGFLDTATRKIESLEKDLLEKKGSRSVRFPIKLAIPIKRRLKINIIKSKN